MQSNTQPGALGEERFVQTAQALQPAAGGGGDRVIAKGLFDQATKGHEPVQ